MSVSFDVGSYLTPSDIIVNNKILCTIFSANVVGFARNICCFVGFFVVAILGLCDITIGLT